MKKIVSIIVAVAMLCSILVVPTMAAWNVKKWYIDDATGGAIGNYTTTASVTGIAGKAANDVSTFVTRVRPQGEIDANKTDNHKFQFSTNVDDFGDLIVFGASVYAPVNLSTLYLTGDGGVNISKALNVDSALAPGWNRIVYVYDHSTAGSAKDKPAGSYAIYLNGECINEFGENRVNIFNPIYNGDQITQLRFMVEDIDSNKEISLYVDDAECYAVTTDDKQAFLDSFEVGKPAVDSSSKYTIDGNKLVIDGTATVADVTAGDDTVRVYNKGNLVTDTATVLKHGFDIVVEDSANKIYSYYDVYEKGIVALADDVFNFNSAGFEFSRVSSTVTGASGLFEKADDDESIKITESYAGAGYMYIYHHFDEEMYLVDGERREDYIVVDVNVRNVDYAPGGFMRLAMSCNQHPLVPNTNFNKFNANGWTNLRLVYSAPEGENYKYVDWTDNIPNIKEAPDIIGKAIGHSVLYVNGVKTGEQDIMVTANGNNETGTNFTFASDDLLLMFYDGDTDNARSVYVDDLKIYTSDRDPGAPSAVELTAGSKYTVDNSAKKIGFTEPITLSDIKTANPGVELVAFSDVAYTSQLADGTILEHGSVVTAKGENGMYSTYTVELPADKVFADYSEYNSEWANISNGTTSATRGIDGDENGAYLVYSESRTGDDPQHNAFYGLGTYTAGFFGERPYSIFSVDFKFGEDAREVFFGSNQHTKISSAVRYDDPRLVEGWNNLVCVVDYETNKSITYVNGIPSTPISSPVGKNLQKADLRLVVYDRGAEEGNANDATVPVATIDNIKVYASVTNPFAAPLTYEATAENVTFTACDYIKNDYDYVAIAAAFDANDNLVGNVAIGTDTVTIAKDAGAAYYMGYIWNSTTGLIPVTAAVRAE